MICDRRSVLGSIVGAAALVANGRAAGGTPPPSDLRPNGMHDFDFLFGNWSVQHRRLKSRLTGSAEWESFAGTMQARPILGGAGNVDDNLLELPAGTYLAASIRAFDAGKQQWSIWWLDGRSANIDVPVHGSFAAGVGNFYGEDQLRGESVRVRFRWSEIRADSARWEQAFSQDAGTTWETNWVMTFTRRA